MILSKLLRYGDEKDALGFPPDTLRGAMAAVGKRQSMIGSTATAPGGTSAVPRSISQPGNQEDPSPTVICVVVSFVELISAVCVDSLVKKLRLFWV